MHFDLTNDQLLLRDGISRYLGAEYSFEQWRQVAARGGFSQKHWQSFAELGWLCLPFPEEFGGLGNGPFDSMVILERFGRHMVMEPYLWSVVICGQILVDALAGEQRSQLIGELTEGKRLFACAWVETESRADPRWCETRAVAQADSFVITGRKTSVFHGAQANSLLVTARTGGQSGSDTGIGLFLIDAHQSGIEMRTSRGLDGRPVAELQLHEVVVPQQARIASEHQALEIIERALDHGIAGLAAECLGAMDYLIVETAQYLKTRRQFDRPLAEFQVLQHRLADAYIAAELARSLTYLATSSLGGDIATRKRNVSAAKVQVCRAAKLIGRAAVQLHGGMGLVDDLPISHQFTRLTMNSLLLGEEDWHLQRFSSIPAAA